MYTLSRNSQLYKYIRRDNYGKYWRINTVCDLVRTLLIVLTVDILKWTALLTIVISYVAGGYLLLYVGPDGFVEPEHFFDFSTVVLLIFTACALFAITLVFGSMVIFSCIERLFKRAVELPVNAKISNVITSSLPYNIYRGIKDKICIMVNFKD